MTGRSQSNDVPESRRPVIVIGGPTASGKSEAALAVAGAFDGVIVNADSMQIYQDLRILTARPDDAMLAAAPHRLYGILPGGETCSAGRWRALALAEIAAAHDAGRVPVLVGGTGLYLKALAEGIAPVPDIPAAVVAEAGERLETVGPESFHAALAEIDPAGAAAVAPTDRQRMMRAWSVKAHTGRSLIDWQTERADDAPAYALFTLVLMPERSDVYAACDVRFARMAEAGAVEEVAALLGKQLPASRPIMKAVGVREIARFLAGETSREDMIAAGQGATRRYAKRQYTWFRHQLNADLTLIAQFSERLWMEIFSKIRPFLLTGEN